MTINAGLLATAHHEAGHAIMVILSERELYSVRVIDSHSGYVHYASYQEEMRGWLDYAAEYQCVPAQLALLWRDVYRIADAGQIAEYEIAPLSGQNIADYCEGDIEEKGSCCPPADVSSVVKQFYEENFDAHQVVLFEDCRRIIRNPKISAIIRTLAEMLMRSPFMLGNEVIDLLLANKAATTKQEDMFWQPTDESIWVVKREPVPLVQLALF